MPPETANIENISEVVEKGCTKALQIPYLPQHYTIIKVYKRRFWILFLFSVMSMLSAILFMQFASTANVTSCFYGVSEEAVDWTVNIVLVVNTVLVFPVSLLINYIDLRWTVICASFFSTAAAASQFFTLSPDSFVFVMITSFLSSISTVFVLGIPPMITAKWFPSDELSRACAFGISGNQLGVALGFIFSPLTVSSDCMQKDLIIAGKRNLAVVQTLANVIIFFLIIFTFQNAPKYPPSISQCQKKNISTSPFREILIKLFKNWNFILILIVYGLMIGSSYAFATTLNKLVLIFYPHKEVEMGWMGALTVVAGLFGSVIAGHILDFTGRFKETFWAICIGGLLSFVLFSSLLPLEEMWAQFVAIGIFGFFLASFPPICLEYALEVTYPMSESICACLLNASSSFYGIIQTEIVSRILETKGPTFSNSILGVTFLIGCIISGFISKDYKRSKQNAKSKLQL